jgi:hypothetical protein
MFQEKTLVFVIEKACSLGILPHFKKLKVITLCQFVATFIILSEFIKKFKKCKPPTVDCTTLEHTSIHGAIW